MNDAAKLVGESLLGEDYKTVLLGGKAYSVSAPVTKIMCRILKEWSHINIKSENQSILSIISQIPENRKPILNGLCRAIIGDSFFWRIKYWILIKKLDGTSKELNSAVATVVELMGAEPFFVCARSCESATKIIAKAKY